jgi:HlyD family secretion protein
VRVNVGDTAIITVDAFLDTKFKGTVTEIANSAKTTGISADQVTNFDVKILVLPQSYQNLVKEGNPNPLRPGMSATVDIQTVTRRDIITVPIQSVTTRNDTTNLKAKPSSGDNIRTLLFTTDGTYALAKDVKTGIQDNNYIEVISGINAGDEVITSPFSAISKKLSDSTMVEVVKKEELFKIK